MTSETMTGETPPPTLMRFCRAEYRETRFMLDAERAEYICGCGKSAASARESVLELREPWRSHMPASLVLYCPAEGRARTFSRRKKGEYRCPCGGAVHDAGQVPGSRRDETGLYECPWCGQGLDCYGVCTNEECHAYPDGYSLHSHLPEKTLCTDVHCSLNVEYFYAERQRHCVYCKFTADQGGVCDDEDCPSHHPDFDPPDREDTLDRNVPGPGHWLALDGLLNPDGTLTKVGKDHQEWVEERMDGWEELTAQDAGQPGRTPLHSWNRESGRRNDAGRTTREQAALAEQPVDAHRTGRPDGSGIRRVLPGVGDP